jgi:hypothetical protein
MIPEPASFALIDARLIEDTYFLQRAIEPPVLKQPQPVMQGGSSYGTVLRGANGQWRMYYLAGRCKHDAEQQTDRFEYQEALAFSHDGIAWETPSLGLIENGGSRDNNLVMGTHYHDAAGMDLTGASGPEGFCVKDAEQETMPHARGRYTALYLASPTDRWGGVCLAHSDDGLVWNGYPENPLIPGWHDTLNNFFYDTRRGKYVMYLRPPIYAGPHSANRKMARSESADLVHWTVPEVVLDTDELDAPAFECFDERKMPVPRGRNRQVYGMQVFPYGELYIGLAWIYDVPPGTMWIELMHSYDGIHWRREAGREPYITDGQPVGLQGKMVTTFSNPPIAVEDELWIYCSSVNRTHHDSVTDETLAQRHIMLAALKRDRWVGYAAGEREGELLSRPFHWDGGRFSLNTIIADGGEVAASFCDELGHPLNSLGLNEMEPLRGPLNALAAPVMAGPGPKTTLKFPTRGPIRLRLKMRRARVFGWTLG